jgi:hypothetical protein
MAPTGRLRSLLLGPEADTFGRRRDALLAVAAGVLTFVAYALEAFAVSGGVLLLPWHATLVGVTVAAIVGYRGGGLAFGWLGVFAPLFGFSAEWALLSLPSHTFAGKLAFLFGLEGLAVSLLAAVVFGTAGFALGVLARRALGLVSTTGTAG